VSFALPTLDPATLFVAPPRLDGPAPTAEAARQAVAAVCRCLRVPAVIPEATLQEATALVLAAAGLPGVREVVLGPRARIDVLVAVPSGTDTPWEIGVECKIAVPHAGRTAAQVARYLAAPATAKTRPLDGVVLVVARGIRQWASAAAPHPRVRYAAEVVVLSRAWGIGT
jgi:hypothetical protein